MIIILFLKVGEHVDGSVAFDDTPIESRVPLGGGGGGVNLLIAASRSEKHVSIAVSRSEINALIAVSLSGLN